MSGTAHRSLGRARRIAVVLELMPGHCRRILHGIRRYAHLHNRNWRLLTIDTIGLEPLGEGEVWRCDGIVAGVPNDEALMRYRRRRVPFVNISSAIAGAEAPSVLFDNRAIGRLAGEHLASLGLRHFAFFGDARQGYAQERLLGFMDVLDRRGRRCHEFERAPLRVRRHSIWRQAHEQASRFLSGLPRPCGIFACDDQRALLVAQVCEELGLRVPEDAAILGVNDDDLVCSAVHPPLSSIDISPERLGEAAARLLDRLMRGRSAPRRAIRIAPTGVVARQSTDVLAVEDPDIAAAVRFIRTAARSRPLRVSEVCRQAAMSRRTLIARFRRALGHSPKAEITRVRLDRVAELLHTTDWPIKRIAYELRFANPEALARAFHAHRGVSPTASRRMVRTADSAQNASTSA